MQSGGIMCTDYIQERFTNGIGMTFVPIRPGSFQMGDVDGDPDERPVHTVQLTKPFAMALTPVTNEQYERFDPQHRALRGIHGLSTEDDDAVLHVSYEDAQAFCRWLSFREGRTYRLPTEAEWEYACRAGTSSAYYTGETLPQDMQRNQENLWFPQPVSLKTGTGIPNAFGLYDFHGPVEQWCHDWYGSYAEQDQSDPVGPACGQSRVTRGGSHNSALRYLRSASRMAALPQDRSWMIGFRVVAGELPGVSTIAETAVPLHAQQVNPRHIAWQYAGEPMFIGPTPYIHAPLDGTPFYQHNHCPSIAWCHNGDLLAIWFSCQTEAGRDMVILASRLRAGCEQWEPASEFFSVADRNTTGSSLFHDADGKLVHINGVEAGYGWANLALMLRTSGDDGATWSTPTLISPHHELHNQPISGGFVGANRRLYQACDAVWGGEGGTAVHISDDDGRTWVDYGRRMPDPVFEEGRTGAWVAGIHAGVVELDDGRLLALGRGNNISGRMPMSISADGGRTWTYHASPFPPISGGQRLVLLRLQEGPVLFISFTDRSESYRKWSEDSKNAPPVGMDFISPDGTPFHGEGMFAALSWDGGATWPVRRLLSPDEGTRQVDGGGWTGVFTMDRSHSEPMGYLAATQSPDGIVHLVSSKQYYRFNLNWILQVQK